MDQNKLESSFIAEIVLSLMSGTKTANELSQEYSISLERLKKWETQFLENIDELYDFSNPQKVDLPWLAEIAENIREIGLELRDDAKYFDDAISRMEGHVEKFEKDYLEIGKIPRNHVWRPYRFCVQDVVLGLVVVKHSIQNNNLEVEVCLTSDAPDYEIHSGSKMTMAFLLSEAYKCGGSMEIQFSKYVENKNVPYSICVLAEYLGVNLRHIQDGRISPSEARQFYMALTNFSPSITAKIFELAVENKLSVESVCYVVNRGMWTKYEVETIVFGSQKPGSIFQGGAFPEKRHLYQYDLDHSRAAILAGYLDKTLIRRKRSDGEIAIDLEDDVRRLEIKFDQDYYAKIYQGDEEIPLPWTSHSKNKWKKLSAKRELIVLVRARDSADIRRAFPNDLGVALKIKDKFGKRRPKPFIFILYPQDFNELIFEEEGGFIKEAEGNGIGIMVCPEAVASIDMDANARLIDARTVRQ